MIKIGILGDIGSGKSFVAKQFGCPVFNADKEVSDIYKNDKSCYKKIKKKFPKFIKSKALKKNELGSIIKENIKNLKKISNIVHPIVAYSNSPDATLSLGFPELVFDETTSAADAVTGGSDLVITVTTSTVPVALQGLSATEFTRLVRYELYRGTEATANTCSGDLVQRNILNPAEIARVDRFIRRRLIKFKPEFVDHPSL